MARGKCGLRNRSKTKAVETTEVGFHQSKVNCKRSRTFLISYEDKEQMKEAIDRFLAELEARVFVEIHCVNLESCFESRVESLVGEALRENGMFYVTNHGFPCDVLEDLRRLVAVLFSLPLEEKRKCCNAPGVKRMKYTDTPDGETLEVSCGSAALQRMDWRTEPALLTKVMAEYLSKHQGLCHKLFQTIRRSMNPSGFRSNGSCFEPYMQLTIRSYHPAPDSIWPTTLDSRTHSSYLTMTFLDPSGGLQIFTQDRWSNVKPCPGAILITGGDQLQALTEGDYKSCLHRVVAGKSARRTFIDVSFIVTTELESE
ncbi:hypothetical protein R1sor_024704 [Riccia sorocarpa]|uniref:Fe2OG dioxygenase domain-containing protein n=1 Tax=Riccia sorocarpa TaxID=122646 RepID=A0ABD3GRE9_9MARC